MAYRKKFRSFGKKRSMKKKMNYHLRKARSIALKIGRRM